MGRPKVSVIIPIYMTEPYLRECVNSVVDQTYQNLEIILVDDGSPDNCGMICDEYAAKDSRIRVIHKGNEGLSSSRNVGLAASTGEFISFVDSDDIISPVFIESLLLPGERIAQCGYTSDIAKLRMDSKVAFKSISGFEMSEKLCTEGLLTNTVVWSKLWWREYFDGIRFPEDRIHEDEFVTWKIYWNADRIARTDAPLYYYRRRSGSIMSNRLSVCYIDCVDALRERIAFYESRGEVRLAALTKALFCYTLSELRKKDVRPTPEQANCLTEELKLTYKDVMKSKELDKRKKMAVALRMLSPRIYSAVKSLKTGRYM